MPTVTSIVRTGGAPGNVAASTNSVNFTVTFNEDVTGVDGSDFVLTNTGSASGAISNTLGSGSTYTVTVSTLAGDGTLRLDLKGSGTGIQNSGGVAISGGYNGDAYTLDHTTPAALALSSTTIAAANAGNGATLATVTATDSTAITYALANGNGTNDADNASFVMSGNTLNVGGAQLTPGTYHIYLSATDVAGNVSYLAQNINIVNAPLVSSIVRTGNTSANVAASATSVGFTVTFSESVTGVDTSDFELSATDSASGQITSISGSGTTYSVMVNALGGDGTLRLNLKDSGTGIQNGNSVAIAAGYRSGETYTLDHSAPAAPIAATMTSASDSGISNTDRITSNVTPAFTGIAEANATVKLYENNGATLLGTTTADGSGNWRIQSSALSDGGHTITVRAVDAAGNVSAASNAITVTIDTTVAPPSVPALAAASDSGVPGDGLTNVVTPTITGTAEANASITLYDTDGVSVLGTSTANNAGAWSIVSPTLSDGNHTLTAKQTDLAGNVSSASAGLTLNIDSLAPSAPSAPVLNAASDTGTIGDGITTVRTPTFTGTGEPNATVRLYDTNDTLVGTAVADGAGTWRITTAALALGVHTLRAKQTDVAGNTSPVSATFALTVQTPDLPPATSPESPVVSLNIDGAVVTQQTLTLPDGSPGSRTIIGIITNNRIDTNGAPDVADIALATNTNNTVLLAQLAPGYGLTAVGGASQAAGSSARLLSDAILAVASTAEDKAQLVSNGTKFLTQSASSVPLLINTITPISTATAPTGALTLTGSSTATQHTALVIDTKGLAAGSNLVLNAVDFAAVIGSANVTANTVGQTLVGDTASQHFTLSAGNASRVLAGGGNDILTINPVPLTSKVSTVTTTPQALVTDIVHGGQGIDIAEFSGVRQDFDVSLHRGYALVSSKAQPGQQSIVINVESLKFSDTTIQIDNAASLSSLAGLYQSVLGRQADYRGIEFWADAMANGVSAGKVALGLISSVEAQAQKAAVFNGDASHDVALLYQTIFNRNSDADGLNFWAKAMAQGMSLEDVARHFIDAPEMEIHKIGAQNWDFQLS